VFSSFFTFPNDYDAEREREKALDVTSKNGSYKFNLGANGITLDRLAEIFVFFHHYTSNCPLWEVVDVCSSIGLRSILHEGPLIILYKIICIHIKLNSKIFGTPLSRV
jgi:hypothetical protein